MKVYRVYSSYHDSSESGTKEYGVFSTKELALARAREVWVLQEWPDPKPEDCSEYGMYVCDGWNSYGISIRAYEVDAPVSVAFCGYT